MSRAGLTGFICAVSLLTSAAPAAAIAGELDTSFGSGGKVFTAIGPDSFATAVAVQPDGRLIAAGWSLSRQSADFALARYQVDGALDQTFGPGGTVLHGVGLFSGADALVLQPDGLPVAAGFSETSSGSNFALARYDPTGAPDATFGSDGTALADFGGFAFATSLARQPDGKLVSAGAYFDEAGTQFALARHDQTGTLDASFGSGGKVLSRVGADGFASAVVVQPDGKVVAAGGGGACPPIPFAPVCTGQFGLIRYDGSGRPDSGFGVGGSVLTPVGDDGNASGLLLQPDGKLVAGGYAVRSGRYQFALARYNPNGQLDGSFGSNGLVFTPMGAAEAGVRALALQPDGKLVAAGWIEGEQASAWGLARYTPNGALDPTFGQEGRLVIQVGERGGTAGALALQPDGRIVGAGTASDGEASVFALTRLHGDNTSNEAQKPPSTSAPPAPPAGAQPPRGVQISVVIVRKRGGRVVLRIASPDPRVLTGTATLKTARPVRVGRGRRPRTLRIARGAFRLLPGRPQLVTLTVSRAGRRIVRRFKKLRVTATVAASDSAGNRTAVRKTTTLRR